MRSLLLLNLIFAALPVAAADSRPNILWISTEDISPDLGCYGDTYAKTPNLDKLASEGTRFTRCFTHAGVCAPSRSGLITGMYPPSIGTHHMRCQGVPPAGVRCFPEYFREIGYYCSNNVKTDYQFAAPLTAWDANNKNADWRGRREGQPFFCVINFTTTHESQIRDPSQLTQQLVSQLPADQKHDPAHAVVPPFYPDTPIVRKDLANYADNISAMDGQVGEVLARLEKDGLAEDTIVWFWGDHGRGLPRYKRWLYDSGTRVPLIIRVPEKWRHLVAPSKPESVQPGSVDERLVAFVDFAPTMLSLAGVQKPPAVFHGQAFLGPATATTPRQYVYGHRDRMDQTYDLIRMVRDERFQYIRNFMADVSYSQRISYMDQMPTMQEWRRLHAENKLHGGPAQFFRLTKPVEELYDTTRDPYALNNLAADPQYADDLKRLRDECERWMLKTGDVGLIPEAIFDELKRPGGVWQTVEAPVVQETIENGETRVTLTARQPGVHFVYALGTQRPPAWRLYSESFAVPADEQAVVRGCRLGYRDSPNVTWTVGQPPSAPTGASTEPPAWREVVDNSGVLPRLLKLRQADLLPDAAAHDVYGASLDDSEPAMRYWAVRHWWRTLPQERRSAEVARLDKIAQSDSSPVVRILAAELVARSSDNDAAIQLLAGFLQENPQESVKLAAAHALRELGDRAKAVRPAIEKATKDGEYVGRVTRDILERWDAGR